ncbi:ribonuclease D [Tessaracoccus bendigoensis DSM 12906]|uniref:Ribonuclease D n=1 Tax=Tessaracoccus bendigoensis DSM 12906 TaxID=1123357 RepID=A0A1M6KMK5_9ACTN|nr:HRDC domain-containing protein [Tessaracoccus bendigoensis]SHJ60160.1 ribonuclease D [Tessaracoccus bendigoensis DSM 12906]
MTGYVESSREPLRPVVQTEAALEEALDSLAQGSGDVAFDTERAHGHRYWPKAYLLQIRRAGSGTWLIDPVAFEHSPRRLGALVEAVDDANWIIHAASQDLPCMQEIGIVPPRVFDTEMAARLLGKPSASLGSLLESEMGIRLHKAHSADNWSKRPLPPSWLAYAALDVDYLIDLADVLHHELDSVGRTEWSLEEDRETLARFSAPPTPRPDPWRRLSGVTTLRAPVQLAVARELWLERDQIAQRCDRPPTWILPNNVIVETASLMSDAVPSKTDLSRVRGLNSNPGRRYLANWLGALDRVRALPEQRYPPRRAPQQGLPHPRSWERTNPDAATRWLSVRPAVDALACELGVLQPSILAPPHALQDVVYHHEKITREDLLEAGIRPWQADFLAPAIAEALGQPAIG